MVGLEFLAAGGFAGDVETWIEAGGYAVLFGLLFACGLGLPLPEDIPLLIAGALIAKGQMSWLYASIAAWAGIIGGDCVLYYLGKRYGLEITRVPFVGKHLTKQRIERAEEFFTRYGVWVVAVGRLFAGIRGAMVVAAGATRFSFIKFVIADGLAALISGGLFVLLGFWLGQNMGALLQRIDHVKHWVTLGIILLVIVGAIWFFLRRRKQKEPVPPEGSTRPSAEA